MTYTKAKRHFKKRISKASIILSFFLFSTNVACTGSAAEHITNGLKCSKSPLEDFCAPIKVGKKTLKSETIKRESADSLLHSSSFLKKYPAVYFSIASEKDDCSSSSYDLDSVPTTGNFYKYPEGTYKVCAKYYLNSDSYNFKASEPIKLVATRSKKPQDSWFIKELKKVMPEDIV